MRVLKAGLRIADPMCGVRSRAFFTLKAVVLQYYCTRRGRYSMLDAARLFSRRAADPIIAGALPFQGRQARLKWAFDHQAVFRAHFFDPRLIRFVGTAA